MNNVEEMEKYLEIYISRLNHEETKKSEQVTSNKLNQWSQNWTDKPKIYMKPQKMSNSLSNLKNEEQS